MKVLSLFNGISALHLALDRASIPVNTLYYAEIDVFANKVTQAHYPEDINLGDVNDWKNWEINWKEIDLIGAGFPCQSWSMAGLQQGDKDERGKLFWTMLDIIKHAKQHNPKVKFIIENVKMKKDFEQYITFHTEQALGEIEKNMINSAMVSAQDRKRYYWTNFQVNQPQDLNIKLKDILDTEIDPVFYYGKKSIDYMQRGNNKWAQAGSCRAIGYTQDESKEKSFTLTANMHKGVPYNYFKDSKGYRKLTPSECARLQTFPENWCSMISNTQAYKCYGNAWTVDIIVHILNNMKEGLVKENAPEGATHYDKFGNYYKVKAINYQWQNGWIMMTHSIMYPIHEIKTL